MNNRIRIKVAGHYIDIDYKYTPKQSIETFASFAEFISEDYTEEALFTLEIDRESPFDNYEKRLIGSFPIDNSKVLNEVYSLEDGRIYQVDYSLNNMKRRTVYLDKTNMKAYACIVSNERNDVWDSITAAYAYFFILHGSLMIHSSVIEYKDRGYLFLGKSGTGKSTHSELWCRHIEGATLLNDDAPIVSCNETKNIVSGSPWSGKTPCYRNKSVEIGAIVQLHQSKTNKIVRVSPLRAMAIIMPCIVGDMKWDKEIHGNVISIVEKLVQRTTVYEMWCTPDKEAALLSYSKIVANEWTWS